jgi:hypothetical protein
MAVVADKLLGYMQYLDVVGDCITIFSLQQSSRNEVEIQRVYGSLHGCSYAYASKGDRNHRSDVKSKEHDAARHFFCRSRGGRFVVRESNVMSTLRRRLAPYVRPHSAFRTPNGVINQSKAIRFWRSAPTTTSLAMTIRSRSRTQPTTKRMRRPHEPSHISRDLFTSRERATRVAY